MRRDRWTVDGGKLPYDFANTSTLVRYLLWRDVKRDRSQIHFRVRVHAGNYEEQAWWASTRTPSEPRYNNTMRARFAELLITDPEEKR